MIEQPVVYMIDDDAAVRDSLHRLLASVHQDCQCFATAGEFRAAYRANAPGCLVLDIRMPGMSGLELQTKLLEESIHIPVIFLTAFGTIPLAVNAMKHGAVDFIEKPYEPQRLIDRINEALRVDDENQRRRRKIAEAESRIALLTSREREVFDLIVAGLPNKAISAQFEVSQRTIEIHRSRMMSKLQSKSICDLFRIAALVEHSQGKQGAAIE